MGDYILVIELGDGKVGVGSCVVNGEQRLLMFQQLDKAYDVGEVLPSEPFEEQMRKTEMMIKFKNPESIDVVMRALHFLKNSFEGGQ